MPRAKPTPKPHASAFVPKTAEDAMLCKPWMAERKPDENAMFDVFVFGAALDDGSFERFVLAKCPSLEIAREIVFVRNLSESATNLVGAIERAIKDVQKGPEADAHTQTYRRAARAGLRDNRLAKPIEPKPFQKYERTQFNLPESSEK